MSLDKNYTSGTGEQKKIEVVYFKDCPNATLVIQTLESNGIPFETIVQDDLAANSPKRALSSPSVLVNGVQIIGSPTTNGCSSCTVFDISPNALLTRIRAAMQVN